MDRETKFGRLLAIANALGERVFEKQFLIGTIKYKSMFQFLIGTYR
ncbi:hypothetical protein [Paenibacillus phage SV21]|nr:hypothetical protein [Paenibacillus phage SV21]